MMRNLIFVSLCLLAGCQTAAPALPGEVVVETMNSGGYTYMQLQSGEGTSWYAVPECKVAVGDRVEVASGAMTMQNFESRTLKRTFPVIYFAQGVTKVGPASGE